MNDELDTKTPADPTETPAETSAPVEATSATEQPAEQTAVTESAEMPAAADVSVAFETATEETPAGATEEADATAPAEVVAETAETIVADVGAPVEDTTAPADEPTPVWVKPAKIRADKPAREKKAGNGFRLFKRIYYPVLGVLLAIALTMGFIDALAGGAGKTNAAFVKAADGSAKTLSSYARDEYSAGIEDASRYVYNELTKNGFTGRTAATDSEGYDTADIYRSGNQYKPTVVRVTSRLMPDTVAAMDGDIAVAREVTNVIAIVPGTGTGKALVMTARYDATPGSVDASSAVSVGVLMQAAMDAAKNGGYENDVVFLFTEDGGRDYGLYAFTEQFKGFNGVTERVGLVGEFAPLGDGSTVTLYAGGNAAVLGRYTSVNKSGFMSSAINKLLGLEAAGGAFDAPAVSVGTAGTPNPVADTYTNLSANSVKRQAGVVNRFLTEYGSADLAKLDKESAAVFFSYLNLFTVVYPAFVSYILGGVIIGLMAAVIAANAKKKAFSFGRSAGGAFVQILTILACVLSLFVAYYLIGLLCAGFGAFNVHSINSLLYSNVGLLMGAMLLSFALSAAFNTVLKKIFLIKAPDLVRGNVWLWAILGAILSFAAPALAYTFAIGAILELVVLLCVTLFKDKYKAKFGSDIDRLFLFTAPLVFVLPMAVSLITAASVSFKLLFLPLIMIIFLLMAGFVTPYASYLVPVLDRAAKKLPQRKIRVERTFTEEKVDPAKPGKKGEIVTYKKVVTEKVDWKYRNWLGVTVVSAVACLVLVLSSVFGGSVTANAGARFSYEESVYDNAVVYVWSKTSAGTEKQIVIKDTDAYKYFSRVLSGYSWDSARKAYVKTVHDNDVITAEPSIAFAAGTYTFSPFDSTRSQVRLTVTGASAVTKFVFAAAGADDTYEIVNNGESTVDIVLPYGFGSFTMTTEGTTGQLSVQYTEYRPGEDSNIKNCNDWLEISAHYADDSKVAPYLNAGIVLEYQF